MAIAQTCDKDLKRSRCQAVTGVASCPSCGKQYARCADHGGQDGANRSLRSHFTFTCYDVSLGERQRALLNPGRF